MGLFIFILLTVLLSISVMLIVKFDEFGIVFGVLLFIFAFTCGIAFPYMSHNSSLATIENSAEIIKIQEDYKLKLKGQLDSLPKVDVSLMSGDSPYSSIISEIARSEQKILTANEEVLSAKIKIQKRERGLTSYILWFF